jgi:predicted CoA-substrate-specific enzyme activase
MVYIGIDVGSVSTNIVLLDEVNNNFYLKHKEYIRTHGNPLRSVQEGLQKLSKKFKNNEKISGVGVTGSARYLIAKMVGADIIKNEITAHSIAATHFYPDAHTIIEIGGQDSKIIILKDSIITDFAMNNVCAAGTGSFLDQQSTRLGIKIEDFGAKAMMSKSEVRIAGRCTVFAESDMIHKQQLGYTTNDIINGLCEALVRNYMSSVAKGKLLHEPILFQGGVAANIGIRRAFEKYLDKKIIIPEHFDVMGAIGAAILAHEKMRKNSNSKAKKSAFKGFSMTKLNYKTKSFTCKDCANNCEVVEFLEDDKCIAYFNDKCGKYSS